jgi:hypothetical protein
MESGILSIRKIFGQDRRQSGRSRLASFAALAYDHN